MFLVLSEKYFCPAEMLLLNVSFGIELNLTKRMIMFVMTEEALKHDFKLSGIEFYNTDIYAYNAWQATLMLGDQPIATVISNGWGYHLTVRFHTDKHTNKIKKLYKALFNRMKACKYSHWAEAANAIVPKKSKHAQIKELVCLLSKEYKLIKKIVDQSKKYYIGINQEDINDYYLIFPLPNEHQIAALKKKYPNMIFINSTIISHYKNLFGLTF